MLNFLSDQELNCLSGYGSPIYDQLSNRHWLFEPTGARTAGINKEHTSSLFNQRFVGMPRDDDSNPNLAGINIELGKIVDHVNEHFTHLQELGFAQLTCPSFLVTVPFHGCDWGDSG
jgi:hypothetical protein